MSARFNLREPPLPPPRLPFTRLRSALKAAGYTLSCDPGGGEQVDRRSIDDSKKEEGGCKARRSKCWAKIHPLVACTFIAEKYIHVPSSLSPCVPVCRSFRAAPWILVWWRWYPASRREQPGVSLGVYAFVRFKLLCGDDAPGSLSRAFRGYEIFGHRESMMGWWTGWLVMRWWKVELWKDARVEEILNILRLDEIWRDNMLIFLS